MLKRGFQFAPGYRLQEFLGRGQFGQVWRATAPGGAATAVKFIDLSDGQGQKEYDAIRRVKQIRHANLMPITAIWLLDELGHVIEEAPDEAIETIDLSVVEAPGQSAVYRPEIEPSWLAVAMLLGGKSLQHRLRECITEGLSGLPPRELLSYMEESAKGIDFLNMPQHDLGEGPIAIQHSDIKPANIVLIGSSAVVCDFGLARILSRNQVTATSAAGTPAYMAPEAIAGKPCRTSDQYSLAVTYYHLRTGSLPVNDGSLWEVLDAHRQGKLKLGLVPEPEQMVLRKATDLNWENRFDTNVDFVDALREALRSEGETRPSFLPPSSAASRNASEGSTVQVRHEVEATTDLRASEASTDASIYETAPFTKSQESAQGGAFINATLPALDEAQSPTVLTGSSYSLAARIKRYPKSAIAITLAAPLMLAVAMIAPRGSEENLPEEISSSGSSGDIDSVTTPPPIKTAEQLLSEAIALVDTDSESAKSLFQQALRENPELQAETHQFPGQEGPVMQMRVTPDGRWLVSMADGPSPTLHDLANRKASPISLKGHDTLLNDLAIDPSGRLLLTGGFDSSARVWNLKAKDVAAAPLLLSGHGGEVDAVAWSPSKPIAVTAATSSQPGLWEIGLWEIGSTKSDTSIGPIKREKRIPIGEQLKALACDPSDNWIAATTLGDDPLSPKPDVVAFRLDELWNAQGAAVPVRLGATNAKHISFLSRPSTPTLVTGEIGGTVAIYSIGEKDNLIERLEPAVFSAQNHIEALRVVSTEENDFIVAGASDSSVLWWKYGALSEQKRRDFCGSSISCVDASPDGRWVAVGTTDGSAWLWDTHAKDGKAAVMLMTNSASIDSIAIASDSNWLVAGCDDGVIRLWNLGHVKLMAIATPTDCGIIDGPPQDVVAPRLTMR